MWKQTGSPLDILHLAPLMCMGACILWKAEKAKYFKNVIMFACILGFIAVQSDKYFCLKLIWKHFTNWVYKETILHNFLIG